MVTNDRVKRSQSIVSKDPSMLLNALQEQKAFNIKKMNLSDADEPDDGFNFSQNQDMEKSSSSDGDDEYGTIASGMMMVSEKQPTGMLDNFTAMYGGPLKVNNKAFCVILPTAKWKLIWDFWVVFLLLVVSLLVPYRLAFDPIDSPFWVLVYYSIDANFVIDMILTFFTATIDPKTQVVCTDKKEICRQYFGFWFWIDLISVLPLDAI